MWGVVAVLGFALAVPMTGAVAAPSGARVQVQEYRLPDATMGQLRDRWLDDVFARYPAGTWAPMKVELTDEQLALMGLPPHRVLASRRYPEPTMVDRAGNFETVDLPPVASVAGAGYFGIRPGAWILLIDEQGTGWCSAAHVYGSPGSYDISTAGHCGKNGTVATVIAAFGNRAGVLNPILLDFGKFATSRDNGLGADWALIDIESAYQHLVSPTMPVWGGPRGMYTDTGRLVDVKIPRRGFVPEVTVTPNPFLAQQIVHYGHGLGVGTGGTPRSGTAIAWDKTHYMFFGAISPGDSGSGANTLTGDGVGANMEAAGIMTHLWVDPLMRSGLGIMGGTRATVVSGTLANGQIVPYPVPAPGLP